MQTIAVTVLIPEPLAHEAEEFDLLDPDMILTVLRDEVDRRVMELVNREIQAYRAEKRAYSDQLTQTQ